MRDFTLDTFRRLLSTLKASDYTIQTFAEFLKNPASRSVILRHDVDARKMNSLHTARIEKELGITGTYYLRMVPESFDEEVIKQIAGLGHEIGYHYEDLSRSAARGMRHAARSMAKRLQDPKTARPQDCKQQLEDDLASIAIESFKENLARLRRVVPVETICMHGSPLSKYDNRKLWSKYNYKDYGILGEPYFDINFDEILYITDTGRRWDGDSVNIRDKAESRGQGAGSKEKKMTERLRDDETKSEEHRKLHAARRTPILHFHSTYDIIRAVERNLLPSKIMITIHPQRWDNRPFPWIKELVWQNVKNMGKRIIASK